MNSDKSSRPEARLRRRQGMMPIFMFGLVGLGMIMIPMGFQFLAVLGGKALLLAKMALMLTSIQGLKRVATSNVHYGLYAAPQPWYDRKAEDYPYRLEDYYTQLPAGDYNYNYVRRVSNLSQKQ